MKLYRRIMGSTPRARMSNDPLHVYGMAAAWTAVDALRKAGKDLTRESLAKVLDTFTATGNPFLLPGIAVKTAGKDHFPVEQMLLQRWQKRLLELVRRALGVPRVVAAKPCRDRRPALERLSRRVVEPAQARR